MSESLFERLGNELRALIAPVVRAVEDPAGLENLLVDLGVGNDNPRIGSITAAVSAATELAHQIEDLADKPAPSLAEIDKLLSNARQMMSALRSVDGASPALAILGEELVQLLVGVHLFKNHPLAYRLGILLTLIESFEEATPTPFEIDGDKVLRTPVIIPRFRPERLVRLVRDPAGLLRSAYLNELATQEDANAMAEKLFLRIGATLSEFGVAWRYGVRESERALLGDAAAFVDHSLSVYAEEQFSGATADAGVTFSLSPASHGDLGLVVCPFGVIAIKEQFGKWLLEADVTTDIEAVAYGRHGLTLVASPSVTQVTGRVAARLAAPSKEPAFIFGAAEGSRLEVGGAQLKLEASLSGARQTLALSANVSSSALVISPGDGDGFLSSILPADGMRADFDLGLGWSSERGLTLRGSAGLEASLPVGLSIGAVKLSTIYLSLQAHDASVLAEVSANIAASIGPVQAVVDRVGIATEVSFPKGGGNLGVADLNLGFKPPSGAGLSIDEAAVTGGGFLAFDSERGQYAGVVELKLEGGIAVKGLGLIATRLPDNVKGFSLLIIITAEDFKPIPLPLGFRLTGIGGLLAINRTVAQDVLRAGLKNHTLESVMFPKDPIRNAPQILSNLNSVFPPANGHYLFGPMAQIAWGTPTLITAELALVLELGARLRLLILAHIEAILPKREHDLVRLQMDAFGSLDFDQGTAELDASLHDSRLLKKFVLTGDMALRLKWEGSRNFALAIGGLHPAFNPPPNFPKLERIAINLSAGDNPRLRAEAYIALTSNTVQFGARAELYASAAGFSIQGEIGFDELIQPVPFHFLANYYAQVQLKRGSTSLFKVRVEGALEGPRPLHIKAKATFEVLWWDVSIRIDQTLLEGELPPLPEPIDVLPLLKEALGNPGNWLSQFPAGQRPMVTLRAKPGAATDVLLHPLGTLVVKQSVVPLNMDISRFGQTAPSGARRFAISSVSLGGANQRTESVRDFFAPAQFFDMSDEEKLSRPSLKRWAPESASARRSSPSLPMPTIGSKSMPSNLKPSSSTKRRTSLVPAIRSVPIN